jgi:hypothetical protein
MAQEELAADNKELPCESLCFIESDLASIGQVISVHKVCDKITRASKLPASMGCLAIAIEKNRWHRPIVSGKCLVKKCSRRYSAIVFGVCQ